MVSEKVVLAPSSVLAFKEALEGGRGELDSWLECNNEAEVRAHVQAYAAGIRAEVLEELKGWAGDGRLQTFEDRERFRAWVATLENPNG